MFLQFKMYIVWQCYNICLHTSRGMPLTLFFHWLTTPVSSTFSYSASIFTGPYFLGSAEWSTIIVNNFEVGQRESEITCHGPVE